MFYFTNRLRYFGGSHRFILDYLVDEVLVRQPQAIQHFLLHISILNRLTAPLCDALLAAGDLPPLSNGQQPGSQHPGGLDSSSSQQILERLENQNLFTLAAEWLAEIAPSLLQQGKLLTLKSYLRELPREIVRRDYRLAMVQAWAATSVMNHRDPEPDFDYLDQLLEDEPSLNTDCRDDLQCQVLAMRTTWAVMANQITLGLHHAQTALARLPADAVVMHNLITLQVGNTHTAGGVGAFGLGRGVLGAMVIGQCAATSGGGSPMLVQPHPLFANIVCALCKSVVSNPSLNQ